MFDGIEIHIGKQTRTLRFTHESIIVAQQLLPGHMTVPQALAMYRDIGVVAICAACALRHEGKGKERVSPTLICRWLDEEPSKYLELEAAVLKAAEAHYTAVGLINAGDLTGDRPSGEAAPASAAASSPSLAGSISAASPDAGTSTLDSSSS